MGATGLLIWAFVVLQVVQISQALDLGASINPFSHNKQFIVRIVEHLPSLDDFASERLTTYRDAEGQDYSCIMPASPTGWEGQTDEKALYKEENAKDLLLAITGDCVRQKEGWWVFEVCVGKHVRQYHTTNGALDEEYMMGRFNETEQDYNLQGQPGAPLHAVQVYTRGQICDLTGMERRVEVRFLCSDDQIHIKAIEEIVSCQYVIVVGTPAMCSEALGTTHGGHEKARLEEVFCKVDESSRDTHTVLQQAIASSVANARSRGEPHVPEPSSDEAAGSDTGGDAPESQGKEEEYEIEEQETRSEL